jgi:hypothetical protein
MKYYLSFLAMLISYADDEDWLSFGSILQTYAHLNSLMRVLPYAHQVLRMSIQLYIHGKLDPCFTF